MPKFLEQTPPGAGSNVTFAFSHACCCLCTKPLWKWFDSHLPSPVFLKVMDYNLIPHDARPALGRVKAVLGLQAQPTPAAV